MTSNEREAHEVLERLIDRHPAGWVGVEKHGDLLAIGAVGHRMARLWRSAEEMARDLAERIGRGGMRPVAFVWRGDNWCILARPASPPAPPGRIVDQIGDLIRTKQHDEFGRGFGPGLRSDPSAVSQARPYCSGTRGKRGPKLASRCDFPSRSE